MSRSSLRKMTGLVVVLGVWQAMAGAGVINAFLLPSPERLTVAGYELVADGSLFRHTLASLERVLIGFLLAASCGMVLGIVLGWSRVASDFVRPVIECLRPIPPIAWTPIAILWFGVGNAPSYFLVFIGAIFPVFVNTFVAVHNIDRTQINAALCLGAGPGLLIRDVLVPASLPIIFPGLRVALGIGWMCVVTAELIAAQSGLGYMIQQNRVLLQTQNVVVGMVTIGVIGFGMSGIMTVIERHVIPWSQAYR